MVSPRGALRRSPRGRLGATGERTMSSKSALFLSRSATATISVAGAHIPADQKGLREIGTSRQVMHHSADPQLACGFPSSPGIPNTIEMASRALAANATRYRPAYAPPTWPALVESDGRALSLTGSGLDTAISTVPRRTTTTAPTGSPPLSPPPTPWPLLRVARSGGRGWAQRGSETHRAQCTGRFRCATPSQSKGRIHPTSSHLSPACRERSITQILGAGMEWL